MDCTSTATECASFFTRTYPRSCMCTCARMNGWFGTQNWDAHSFSVPATCWPLLVSPTAETLRRHWQPLAMRCVASSHDDDDNDDDDDDSMHTLCIRTIAFATTQPTNPIDQPRKQEERRALGLVGEVNELQAFAAILLCCRCCTV